MAWDSSLDSRYIPLVAGLSEKDSEAVRRREEPARRVIFVVCVRGRTELGLKRGRKGKQAELKVKEGGAGEIYHLSDQYGRG